MVAVAGVSGLTLPGTRKPGGRGARIAHLPCGPRNRPIDASVAIRIGFEHMSNVAGGQQGYVKVDKPTLNERPAKSKDNEGAAAPTARRSKRMPNVMRLAWNARFAFALLAALTAAACASKVNELGAAGAGGGAAVPGSQQDFVVNVGDRLFFDSDST